MSDEYTGPERRNRHQNLVESIVAAIQANQPACLTAEEQQWVRLAIKAQAERAKLRQAVIEKSLGSLVWAAIVGVGYMLLAWAKEHGFK